MLFVLIGYNIRRTVSIGGYLRQQQTTWVNLAIHRPGDKNICLKKKKRQQQTDRKKIEYKVILKWVTFSHVLSPPSHPQSNCLVLLFVGFVFCFVLFLSKHILFPSPLHQVSKEIQPPSSFQKLHRETKTLWIELRWFRNYGQEHLDIKGWFWGGLDGSVC